MENGDGFVTMKVSGTLRDQKLLVYNWDTQMNVHLVSEMCLEITESKVFLNRTSDCGFSEWFKKSSHSE